MCWTAPRNRWTVRVDVKRVRRRNVSGSADTNVSGKPAHGCVERFHATLEGLMRTWRNDVVKRYGVSLPAHHPTVVWLVRHCAWLHDRFVMK